MNNAITCKTNSGMTVTLAPKHDERITHVVNARVFCRSEQAIRELQGELRAWGVISMPIFAVG